MWSLLDIVAVGGGGGDSGGKLVESSWELGKTFWELS